MLVHWADGRVEAIDGREMAPAAAHRDMYIRNGKGDQELSANGALAVGIPGSVAAFDYLLKEGGKLTMGDLLLPAADLAERGFAIDSVYASRIVYTLEQIRRFPEIAKLLLDEQGNPHPEGYILSQKDLAATYRKIAEQGADYFYKGKFARDVDAWMKSNAGLVRADDFANYSVKHRQPLKSQYRDYTIVGFPPPSSGGVHVAQILSMLESFDIGDLEQGPRYHVLAESMKRAFADRAYWLGDPDFVPVPRGLLSADYSKQRASTIRLDKATESVEHGIPPLAKVDLFGKHTTHITTADKAGNWVSITTTVNTPFGAKVIVPGTGVILNNQMDDFSIQPGVPNAYGLVGNEANSVQAGKRPLSSMSPTLVLRDGKPVMGVGAAGGPTIITQVLHALVNTLDLGMNLPDALSAQRIHHQWKPNALFVEPSMSRLLKSELAKRGHQIEEVEHYGATQAIRLTTDGRLVAASEPRVMKQNQQAK